MNIFISVDDLPATADNTNGKFQATIGLRILLLVIAWSGLHSAAIAREPSAPAAQTAAAVLTAEYQALPGSKAMAIVPGAPYQSAGISHSQGEDNTAALLALRDCEKKRANPQFPCEVIWLNDEPITTGVEILSTVPEQSHPLYLWRYQQGSTTLYLAGSVHVLKASLHPLPIQFETAFAASDHLVLEVDTHKIPPQEMQLKSLEYGILEDGVTLSTLLDQDLNSRLNAALARYGMAPAMVQKLKPSLLMTQLVVARMMALGYLPNYGLEAHFQAKSKGMKILELESLESQLALLLNQPMDTQIALLKDTLDQEAGIEPMMAAMLSAWLSGDDIKFMELFELQQGDSEQAALFTEALLDKRNIGMARGIAALLKTPGDYFVLVGAAHFIGDNGIIELLRKQNIQGERVYSTTVLSKN